MSLLATRNAVGLLISTLGFTKTGELTADSLTVKLPNCTPPRSNSVCANHKLSRDCSFATSQHPFSFKVRLCASPVYHTLFGHGTFFASGVSNLLQMLVYDRLMRELKREEIQAGDYQWQL